MNRFVVKPSGGVYTWYVVDMETGNVVSSGDTLWIQQRKAKRYNRKSKNLWTKAMEKDYDFRKQVMKDLL